MKILLVGLGRAGGAVVDTWLDHDRETPGETVVDAVAVDTDAADLRSLTALADENRHRIDATGGVVGDENGDDAEPADLAAVADDHRNELRRALDDVTVSTADATMLVTALGGETGSVLLPVVADELGRLTDAPTYGIGILPAAGDDDARTVATIRSLPHVADAVDSLLLFDNGAQCKGDEDPTEVDARLNETLVERFDLLLTAGEVTDGPTGESVLDASELINTLAVGGLGAFGRMTNDVERPAQNSRFGLGLLKTDRPDVDEGTACSLLTTTTRRAALDHLSVECALESVGYGALLVSGPPEWLNRRGIEQSRQWVEEATGSRAIRGGDFPREESFVSVSVLFAGVGRIPRLAAIQRRAESTEAEDELPRIVAEDGTLSF